MQSVIAFRCQSGVSKRFRSRKHFSRAYAAIRSWSFARIFGTLMAPMRSSYCISNRKHLPLFSLELSLNLKSKRFEKFDKEVFFREDVSIYLFTCLIWTASDKTHMHKNEIKILFDIIKNINEFLHFFLFFIYLIKTERILFRSLNGFPVAGFRRAWLAPEAQRAIEARGGNLETLKRRAVSAYLRRTYDEKRKRAPVRSCGRPERIVRRRNERGERACSLFCRSTLIYCRRYFLVGASWRLPHYRARQWRARLTFCFELLLALARPVLSISPLLHRARQCSILFCSIFILFCLFVFFFGCVIFRQPLALCCAVAGRRRVSARILRLSWHRFIITITPGIAARTIF